MPNVSRRQVIVTTGLTTLGLAGCVSQQSSDGDGGDAPTEDGETADGGSTPSEPQAFDVLGNLPLSGIAEVTGTDDRNGAKLFFDSLDGPQGNVDFNVSFVDSQCGSETATSNLRSAVSENSDLRAVLCHCSGATVAQMDITKQEELLQMTVGLSPSIYQQAKNHPSIFQTAARSEQLVPPMVNYAIDTLDAQTHAVVGVNVDWGVKSAETWESTAKENGGEVVHSSRVPFDKTDLKDELSIIQSKEPDVLYMATYPNHAVNWTKDIRDLGIRIPEDMNVFKGPVGGEVLYQAAGTEGLFAGIHQAQYMWKPAIVDYEQKAPQVTVDFIDAYIEQYDQVVSRNAGAGYTNAKAIVEGAKRAGSADPLEIASTLRSLDEPISSPFGDIKYDERGGIVLPDMMICVNNPHDRLHVEKTVDL